MDISFAIYVEQNGNIVIFVIIPMVNLFIINQIVIVVVVNAKYVAYVMHAAVKTVINAVNVVKISVVNAFVK